MRSKGADKKRYYKAVVEAIRVCPAAKTLQIWRVRLGRGHKWEVALVQPDHERRVNLYHFRCTGCSVTMSAVIEDYVPKGKDSPPAIAG